MDGIIEITRTLKELLKKAEIADADTSLILVNLS